MLVMNRGREDDDHEQTLDLVNCLMLISKIDQNNSSIKKQKISDRVFACKTCSREFSSFQALGGHRASHKKPERLHLARPSSPEKAKKHECSICGMKFAVGQALGGHMRRHRDEVKSSVVERIPAAATPVLKKSNSSKRVSCLNLDLNLAPLGYHHIKLSIIAI